MSPRLPPKFEPPRKFGYPQNPYDFLYIFIIKEYHLFMGILFWLSDMHLYGSENNENDWKWSKKVYNIRHIERFTESIKEVQLWLDI